MTRTHKLLVPLALVAAVWTTGCTESPAPTPPMPVAEPPSAHDHSAAALHGGSVIELGDHAAFLEVVHDATAATVQVYVTDGNGDPLTPDDAPVLNFTSDGTPAQLVATGEGGTWTFADPALESDPEHARIRIAVAGKTFTPELAHQH